MTPERIEAMLEHYGLDPNQGTGRPEPWDLDLCLDQDRHDRLTALNATPGCLWWDGKHGDGEPRLVLARCWFRGGPGREADAAKAWGWELSTYFKRGVGEPPEVTYEDGVYTVTGLMQTTYPYGGDIPGPDGVVEFR
jgi:hypothetical protein